MNPAGPRPPPPRPPPPPKKAGPEVSDDEGYPQRAPPPVPPPLPHGGAVPSSGAAKLSFSSLYPDDGASSSSSALEGTEPGADEEEDEPLTIDNIDLKKTLVKFYQRYSPDKLDRIDFVLSKYRGEEGELFDDLVIRYKVSEEEMQTFLVRRVAGPTKPARPTKPAKPPKPQPEDGDDPPATLGRILSMRGQCAGTLPPSATASAADTAADPAADDEDLEEEMARAERASQSAAPPIRQGSLTKVRVRDGQRVVHHFILREDALYYVKKKPMDAPIKFLSRLTGWDLGTSTMIERNTRSIDMTKLLATPASEADCEALEGDVDCSLVLRSKRKTFYLVAASAAERDVWMADIDVTRVAAQLQPDGTGLVTEDQTCPLYASKAEASACTLCSRSFGIMARRHHCRDCGVVVCDGCSRIKCRIPRLDERMLFKVCGKCASRLKEARRYGAASVI